jgi:hypothetical protein
MGLRVLLGAALAACGLVFLGSATATSPPGPTSAVKALGVIQQATSSVRPAAQLAPGTGTKTEPSNYAIDPTLQLTYHGGPVMHTHTVHVIYWLPSGSFYGASSGDSTTYENDINQYVQDVAADSGSGKTSNAYGAITQYLSKANHGPFNAWTDPGGSTQYNVTDGGSVVDAGAFPANGCTDPVASAPTCLTDQQLITKIDAVVQSQGWPGGFADEYALVLPANVVTCTFDQSTGVFDICSDNFFCAYHSAYDHHVNGDTTAADYVPFIYLNLPYEPANSCHNDFHTTQPSPHAPSNSDTTIDDMSHEEREAATDPLGTAWYDAAGNESDDKCIDTYGTNLGPTNDFNQLINGDHYDTQTEWSNLKKGCYQMGAPTVSLDSTSAIDGATLGITGANFFTSSPNKPVVTFNKTVVAPANVTVDSPTHLTVTVPDGNTTGKVTVQAIGGTGTSTQTFGLKPTISSLTNSLSVPDSHDVTGTKITVNGTGFFGVKSVKFGTVTGVVSSVATNGTSLKVVVPAAAATGNLTVTTAGGTSDPTLFTVTPHITSFTPVKAPGLSNVTINGTGLAVATFVKFNGDASPLIVSDTATKIVAQVPNDATAGQISVSNADDSDIPSVASFTPTPAITNVSPLDGQSSGTPTTVTITGAIFTGATMVKFGTVNQPTFTVDNPHQITTTVPALFTTSGKISVVGPTGTGTAVSSQTFAVTKVTSFTPATAAANAIITIAGQGLGSATTVDFSGHPAQPVFGTPTATAVKVVVPPDALDGTLTVNTPQASVPSLKSFKPLPRITSFDKATYEAGCTVTITGTNLKVGGAVTLKLGAITVDSSDVNVMNATTVQFVIPQNAVTGVVSFTDGAGSTVSTGKVNVVPTITDLDGTNDTGKVGDHITLAGMTFTGTKSVKFGSDTHAATFTVGAGGTSLNVTVPATAASGKIAVTNAGGTTLSTNFTVTPVISGFSPGNAPAGGIVTVTGSGFVGADFVTFAGGTGNVAGAASAVTPTSLTVIVPDGVGSGPITVHTSAGGVSVYSLASGANFNPSASLTSFSPAGGVPGTTGIVLSGFGFTGVTAVSFNGTAATNYTVNNADQITVDVPAGATTGFITVERSAATTLTSATQFVVPTITSLSSATAQPGDTLEIDGIGLSGSTQVTFTGGATATPSDVADGIDVVVPPLAQTGTVTVTTSAYGDVTSTDSLDLQFTLTVSVSGSGTVTSDVGSINCVDNTGTCSAVIDDNAVVTLTATPDGGGAFVNWSGGQMDQSSADLFQFTLTSDVSTTAVFNP